MLRKKLRNTLYMKNDHFGVTEDFKVMSLKQLKRFKKIRSFTTNRLQIGIAMLYY